MAITNHERVGKALELLKAGLGPFIEREFKSMYQERGLAEGLAEPTPDWATSGGLALSGPLPYLDFLGLMGQAAVVLTDSGGVQEETTALGVPCLTLRPNTERPITLTEGTNHLVPRPELVGPALVRALSGEVKGRVPALWDGRAAFRAAAALAELLGA